MFGWSASHVAWKNLSLELEQRSLSCGRLDFHQLLAAICVVHEEVDNEMAKRDAVDGERKSDLPVPALDLVLAQGMAHQIKNSSEVRLAL